MKLVICSRDDFTCKEPLLLTLRALIDEEYRDTWIFVNWPSLLHSISPRQHLQNNHWFWFGWTQSTFAFICGHLAITDWTIADKYRAHSNGGKLPQRLLIAFTSDSNTRSYPNPRKTLTCRGLYQKQTTQSCYHPILYRIENSSLAELIDHDL